MKSFAIALVLAATPAWAQAQAETQAAFQAEDQTPTGKFTTAAEVRPIMEVTKPNWVAVREYDGQDWVYLTQLLSWRCGLHQIKYSVNGGEMQVWEMPDCQIETSTPNAFPDDQALMILKTYAPGSVETMEVEVLLDDMSEMSASYERAAILIP